MASYVSIFSFNKAYDACTCIEVDSMDECVTGIRFSGGKLVRVSVWFVHYKLVKKTARLMAMNLLEKF